MMNERNGHKTLETTKGDGIERRFDSNGNGGKQQALKCSDSSALAYDGHVPDGVSVRISVPNKR